MSLKRRRTPNAKFQTPLDSLRTQSIRVFVRNWSSTNSFLLVLNTIRSQFELLSKLFRRSLLNVVELHRFDVRPTEIDGRLLNQFRVRRTPFELWRTSVGVRRTSSSLYHLPATVFITLHYQVQGEGQNNCREPIFLNEIVIKGLQISRGESNGISNWQFCNIEGEKYHNKYNHEIMSFLAVESLKFALQIIISWQQYLAYYLFCFLTIFI